jgi:hypothetical protein
MPDGEYRPIRTLGPRRPKPCSLAQHRLEHEGEIPSSGSIVCAWCTKRVTVTAEEAQRVLRSGINHWECSESCRRAFSDWIHAGGAECSVGKYCPNPQAVLS